MGVSPELISGFCSSSIQWFNQRNQLHTLIDLWMVKVSCPDPLGSSPELYLQLLFLLNAKTKAHHYVKVFKFTLSDLQCILAAKDAIKKDVVEQVSLDDLYHPPCMN